MDARARRLLNETPWERLEDAYGSAEDAPAALAALIDPDASRRFGALDDLHGSILHQGTAYSATPPAALFVIALLAGSDVPSDLRPRLVEFLAHVAGPTASALADRARQERLATFDLEAFMAREPNPSEAASLLAPYREILESRGGLAEYGGLLEPDVLPFFVNGQAIDARGALACLAIAPDLIAFFLDALEEPDPRSRTFAAMGAVRLAAADPAATHREALSRRLRELLEVAGPDERAAFVLALGDLGEETGAFLDDPAPGVRLCAALAPALAADPAALALLRSTLERDAVRMEHWFENRPPQFCARPRIAVVKRLVKSARSFDEIADAAVALARVPGFGVDPRDIDFDAAGTLTEALATLSSHGPAGGGVADEEWGSLLALAFPAGDGIVNTDAQRRYLRALVARDDIWGERDGNAMGWFEKAGLPHDREACARRAGAGE